jgi:hypothetical protein
MRHPGPSAVSQDKARAGCRGDLEKPGHLIGFINGYGDWQGISDIHLANNLTN